MTAVTDFAPDSVVFGDGIFEFDPRDFAALTWSHQRQHEVAGRDGWTCAYCGGRLVCTCVRIDPEWERPATIDHRTAQAKGGSHDLDNLVLACGRCNSRKRALEVELAPVYHQPSDMEIRQRAWQYLDQLTANIGDPAHPHFQPISDVMDILSGAYFPPAVPDPDYEVAH